MVKKTGDPLRQRQRRQSHLPRPLDSSGIPPNRKPLTSNFPAMKNNGSWCRNRQFPSFGGLQKQTNLYKFSTRTPVK
jgi:hypothetical protein